MTSVSAHTKQHVTMGGSEIDKRTLYDLWRRNDPCIVLVVWSHVAKLLHLILAARKHIGIFAAAVDALVDLLDSYLAEIPSAESL